jgi:hypothetical protein
MAARLVSKVVKIWLHIIKYVMVAPVDRNVPQPVLLNEEHLTDFCYLEYIITILSLKFVFNPSLHVLSVVLVDTWAQVMYLAE